MAKTLSEYAKENQISYNSAYRKFLAGQIPGATKLFNNSIVIEEPEQPKPIKEILNHGPKTITASDMYRENYTAINTDPANKYVNLENSLLPYKYNHNGVGNCSTISAHDMVVLCAKAYFSVPIVRNVIELMVSFSSEKFYLTGGNKKSRDFFEALFKKINIMDFQREFFTEYYRSGNCFIARHDTKVQQSDIINLTKTYGLSEAAANIELPSRYLLLNPADITVIAGATYGGRYQKILNDYERDALRNPRTPEDKEIFESLPPESKKALQNNSAVAIDLDMSKTYYLHYGKQSYESFAIPPMYGTLSDIEWKIQMKNIDMAICKTVQQAVLLVTTGSPEIGINPNNIAALQQIFANESVGRVLISDFSTQAKFVTPDVSDLLDPRKYQIVENDIRLGLNAVIFGGDSGEKFANKSISLEIFTQKLKTARENFLNNFLNIEIKRISKLMGFKTYPEAKFEDITFKDATEFSRLVTRLGEIGVLTPEELLRAMDTGRLPSPEESIENQEKFKELKDKGLYAPITGGTFDQKELAKISNDAKLEQQKQKIQSKPAGRPVGGGGSPTTVRKKTKKLTPVGKK